MSQTRQEQRYFYTASLSLATFLFAKGQQVAGVRDADDSGKKEFVFVRTDRTDDLADSYRFAAPSSEELLASVRDYENARRLLLDRLKEVT